MVEKGWRVVEPKGPNSTLKPRRLSRVYTVREAADTALALLRRSGHPEAYVAVVRMCADGVGDGA